MHLAVVDEAELLSLGEVEDVAGVRVGVEATVDEDLRSGARFVPNGRHGGGTGAAQRRQRVKRGGEGWQRGSKGRQVAGGDGKGRGRRRGAARDGEGMARGEAVGADLVAHDA